MRSPWPGAARDPLSGDRGADPWSAAYPGIGHGCGALGPPVDGVAQPSLVRLALPNLILARSTVRGTVEVAVHGSQGAAFAARRHTADAQGRADHGAASAAAGSARREAPSVEGERLRPPACREAAHPLVLRSDRASAAHHL